MQCLINVLPTPRSKLYGWPWTNDYSNLEKFMVPLQREYEIHSYPKISIVIPSFNNGPYLEESIRSILLQNYPDLELIIIDGGSSDDSIHIIKKYEPWIDYWVSEPDKGQSNAINKGLEKATGQLFNWHNADDVLMPNCLKVAAEEFIKNKDLSYVFGYLIVIDENSNLVSVNNKHPILNMSGSILSPSTAISNLKAGCQPGCLMNRQLVQDAGGIDENLVYAMDLDITIRINLLKPSYYLNIPQVLFRVHPGSKSSRMDIERANDRLIIARKIFKNKNLPSDIKKIKWHSFYIAHIFAYKNYNKGRKFGKSFWNLINSYYFLILFRIRNRLNQMI